MDSVILVRTDSSNPGFVALVQQLDAYLATTDGDDHAFYHQFNGIESLKHVVLALAGENAVACGAFKPWEAGTVEVKRMYCIPDFRRRGISAAVLSELEKWASELGYESTILETGKEQIAAVQFYPVCGYKQIPNYGQYAGVEKSICFRKMLHNAP